MIYQALAALATQVIPQRIMMSATQKALMSTALNAVGTHVDNRQAEKKAKRKQANFYVNMRNAAQRAGFNPLTVLRSGTAGAYADAGYAPALTSNPFMNMFNDMRETDARISNMKAQERNMAHGQLMDKLNYDLRKAEYQFNQGLASKQLTEKITEYEPNPTGLDPSNVQGNPRMPPDSYIPKETIAQFPLNLFGQGIHPANMSPAAVVEEQYGDAVSWAYGIGKGLADLLNTGHVEWNQMLKRRGYKYNADFYKIKRFTSNSRGNGNVGTNYKVHKSDRFLGVMQ